MHVDVNVCCCTHLPLTTFWTVWCAIFQMISSLFPMQVPELLDGMFAQGSVFATVSSSTLDGSVTTGTHHIPPELLHQLLSHSHVTLRQPDAPASLPVISSTHSGPSQPLSMSRPEGLCWPVIFLVFFSLSLFVCLSVCLSACFLFSVWWYRFSCTCRNQAVRCGHIFTAIRFAFRSNRCQLSAEIAFTPKCVAFTFT